MKGLLYSILIWYSSRLLAQDTTAYILFNSAYSSGNYRLIDEAHAYKLNSSTDSLFINSCRQILSKSTFKNILDNKSKPFKWEQKYLRNTIVISDSTISNYKKEYLRLSAPIFDQTKTYAVVFESHDAISCIHSGPVLLQ